MNHREKRHWKFLKSKLNTDWNMYKTAQNHATNILQCAQKCIKVCPERFWKKSPNKFWKMTKTIVPTKTKEPPARSFNTDAKCTTNKKFIASGFCWFSKVVGALNEKSIRFLRISFGQLHTRPKQKPNLLLNWYPSLLLRYLSSWRNLSVKRPLDLTSFCQVFSKMLL